ncbi:MAG: hypothetical protein EB078_04975 [Proteobacteria bacterium]|nr:hypothetical protein [Pseudomonadota bacterium]NDC24226.1 hypothetical protein [Pseudomonadota bacterium]NDD04237.1 hypothetical protein [Pseudomonadota bacterium]
MLNPNRLKNIFEVARTLGAKSCELYGDTRFQTEITFEMKKSRARSFQTGGVQLVLETEQGPKTFVSSIIDPDYLIRMLTGEPQLVAPQRDSLFKPTEPPSFETHRLLETAYRKTLLEHQDIQKFHACYHEETQQFLFANDQGVEKTGTSTFAWLQSQFSFSHGNTQKQFKVFKGRTDVPSLLSELREPWLSRHRVTKALQKPWPAPRGELPVLWSSSVVAKLTLCLMQYLDFHIQTPQRYQTLLQTLPPFAFQLIDNWKQAQSFDVAGTPRIPRVILEREKLCMEFDQIQLGNFRRQSHRDFPITAPWEPALFGIERLDKPISRLEKGLRVYEAEVVDFHPSSPHITLQIQEASLVHQGQEGDWIEPLLWSTSLTDLFRSFKIFSEDSQPHPLQLHKAGQSLFVEVTAPSALSAELHVPGSVPQNNYW